MSGITRSFLRPMRGELCLIATRTITRVAQGYLEGGD